MSLIILIDWHGNQNAKMSKNTFKHLLRRNHWADWAQILYVASLGFRNESLWGFFYENRFISLVAMAKKVREKSRECHNHKPQPFLDPKRKRKPTNLNKHKSNKRTKSTKIISLFPKRGNRNTKRTEKHKNKITQ